MKRLFIAIAIALSSIATTTAQTKIAHVNSQKLLDTMPSRKAAIADIQGIEKSGVDELTEMDGQIRKAYEEYKRLEPTRSPAVNQYEQGRIQKLQEALESRQTQIDQQLQLMTQEMNGKILARVKQAVNTIATAKKLNYVVDETAMLFSAGGIDITNEVIVELLKLDAEAMKKP